MAGTNLNRNPSMRGNAEYRTALVMLYLTNRAKIDFAVVADHETDLTAAANMDKPKKKKKFRLINFDPKGSISCHKKTILI